VSGSSAVHHKRRQCLDNLVQTGCVQAGSTRWIMSRSLKRTPYFGICCATTAKPYKRLANRRFRRMERAAVQAGREPHSSSKVTPDPRLMAYDDKRYRLCVADRAMRK